MRAALQVIQMKGSELLPQLGAALSSNSVCTELNLTGCNVDDHTIEGLTQALQVNSSLSTTLTVTFTTALPPCRRPRRRRHPCHPLLRPLALQVNSSLTSLSLEANKINNDGAIQIARALKANRSLLVLNLQNQKGTRFGDTALGEFTVSHTPSRDDHGTQP